MVSPILRCGVVLLLCLNEYVRTVPFCEGRRLTEEQLPWKVWREKQPQPVLRVEEKSSDWRMGKETAVLESQEEVVGQKGTNEIDEGTKRKKVSRKERLVKETEKAERRGVCYLSRIPPHMDHVKLRHLLSQHADILRIYLAPEDLAARVHRKRAGGFRGQGFSEGWVEFVDKRVAKRVANMLNGEQIGGRKRSQFYFDLWNIKYLSKFKWDNLTEEIAYKNAVREQKLALELSAAKRERDFYLSKVDKSRALNSIQERLKKKQKVQMEADTQNSVDVEESNVVRRFPQIKPVAPKKTDTNKHLSKDILASVFGGPDSQI